MKQPKKDERFFTLPDGRRLCLHIGKEGFTLWDADNGTWIIDASCIVDGYVNISTLSNHAGCFFQRGNSAVRHHKRYNLMRIVRYEGGR